MLWFFERERESLRLETRYDNDTGEFVAIVRWPDGRQQTERFTEREEFRSWLVAHDNALEAERWTPNTPVVLPYGWPDKPLTELALDSCSIVLAHVSLINAGYCV